MNIIRNVIVKKNIQTSKINSKATKIIKQESLIILVALTLRMRHIEN